MELLGFEHYEWVLESGHGRRRKPLCHDLKEVSKNSRSRKTLKTTIGLPRVLLASICRHGHH
jgi:hypothetical protein